MWLVVEHFFDLSDTCTGAAQFVRRFAGVFVQPFFNVFN